MITCALQDIKIRTIKKLNYKNYNKKVQFKDKNNITDNGIFIRTTKSYPTLKAILNRWVLRLDLKFVNLSMFRKCAGSLSQRLGAADVKHLSPSVFRSRALGWWSSKPPLDLRLYFDTSLTLIRLLTYSEKKRKGRKMLGKHWQW